MQEFRRRKHLAPAEPSSGASAQDSKQLAAGRAAVAAARSVSSRTASSAVRRACDRCIADCTLTPDPSSQGSARRPSLGGATKVSCP